MSEQSQRWEQQPGETAKAFAAFQVYCAISPHHRSVHEAYRRAMSSANHGKSGQKAPGHWTDWAKKYEWETRAQAFDAYNTSRASILAWWRLDEVYEAEEKDGNKLTAFGQLLLDAMLQMSGFTPGSDQPSNPIDLLQVADSRAARVAIDAICKGRDLIQRATERRREVYESLLARIADPPTLSASEEDALTQMMAALIGKAKEGDPVSIQLFLSTRGLLPV